MSQTSRCPQCAKIAPGAACPPCADVLRDQLMSYRILRDEEMHSLRDQVAERDEVIEKHILHLSEALQTGSEQGKRLADAGIKIHALQTKLAHAERYKADADRSLALMALALEARKSPDTTALFKPLAPGEITYIPNVRSPNFCEEGACGKDGRPCTKCNKAIQDFHWSRIHAEKVSATKLRDPLKHSPYCDNLRCGGECSGTAGAE